MKKNKGFTLIEVLSVIIILGILMIIAVPAVTQYIQGARGFSFSKTANKYIEIAMAEVTSLEYKVSNDKYTYYIPTNCLETDNLEYETIINEEGHEERRAKTPYGTVKESYVVVTYKDGTNYYYYTGRDSSGHGFLLTYRDLINEDNLKTDLPHIDTTIGVGDREEVYVYSSACDFTREKYTATYNIPDKGKLED